ncbi:hypothetical protein [Mycobacteroides abscessus]|uniref:hypothetical protein n=1 Tax=Mycobacteroides abscessus TaxID=36809 RepID=UPI0026494CF2|nr:hypothetical protein [Mycobacteroides abscessus]MDO3357793.1 hypothetical protein [Mycobacteroides abscessus subsp. massiliense]WKE45636.1 hypothetical protein P3M63_07480 [Mycobacteroides abscessus subsp. massiliense]
MSTLTPEVRADLTLLRQQTAEVRRALAHTHRLGAERSATVIRLRDAGVTYRVIAAAMSSSVAAVQSILARAEQRVTTPQVMGAAPTVMSAGGAGATSAPASTRAGVVGAAGGVRATGVLGAGTTLKAGAR